MVERPPASDTSQAGAWPPVAAAPVAGATTAVAAATAVSATALANVVHVQGRALPLPLVPLDLALTLMRFLSGFWVPGAVPCGVV
ncbi:hypothetical protein GCM10027091_31820 [Streptomyces daliensis]